MNKKYDFYELIQSKISLKSESADEIRNALSEIINYEKNYLDKINNDYEAQQEKLEKDNLEGKITEKEYKKISGKNTDRYNEERVLSRKGKGIAKELYKKLEPFMHSKDSLLIKENNFNLKFFLDMGSLVLLYKEQLTYEKEVLGNKFKIEFNLSSDNKKIYGLKILMIDKSGYEIYVDVSMEPEPQLTSFVDTKQKIQLERINVFPSKVNTSNIIKMIDFESFIDLNTNDIESTILLTLDYELNISKSPLYPDFQQGIKEFLNNTTPEITNTKKNSNSFKQNK